MNDSDSDPEDQSQKDEDGVLLTNSCRTDRRSDIKRLLKALKLTVLQSLDDRR